MMIPTYVHAGSEVSPEDVYYQLTVGDVFNPAHCLASLITAPTVGDEIGLAQPLLAGLTVYEVVGVQDTMAGVVRHSPSVKTLFLKHKRQEI